MSTAIVPPSAPSREPGAGPTYRGSVYRHLGGALVAAVVLVVGIGGWACFTQIAGAVIAQGQVVVDSNVKKVQHPTGGVVGEIRVKEGQAVTAGEVLIRLDETQTRASLDIVLKSLDEMAGRRARNEAERDARDEITFPPDLLARRSQDPTVAHLLDGETRLFNARVSGRSGQKAQLRERIAQLKEEVDGTQQQIVAKEAEIKLIGTELAGVRELFAKNLVPISRVTALERDAVRLEGDRGRLVAGVASARGKMSETELQILQIDGEMRSEVGKELAEIRAKWSELVEKRVAAEDQLRRIDLRAPLTGVVHQLSVHTVGGLITPNEPAMLIVPSSDSLTVEVRLQPQDIDSVHADQKAVLRFAAFNQRVTPEIDGVVTRVSADVVADAKTGATFYTARVRLDEDQIARLGNVRLQPGMPVDAHLRIGDRSVISYLTKPLVDQMAKAWRER